MDRCGALTSVMCDPARLAMTTCAAGGMTWAAVPMTSQDGIVCQAGVVVSGSDRMLATGGCCSAASAAPSRAGRPLAKHPGNTLWLTYASASPEGAPGYGTKCSAVGLRHDPGSAVDRLSGVSPAAGMKASSYTSALTCGLPVAALVMTNPP